MQESEEMMRRLMELITRVDRSEGVLVEKDFPLREEEVNEFVPGEGRSSACGLDR